LEKTNGYCYNIILIVIVFYINNIIITSEANCSYLNLIHQFYTYQEERIMNFCFLILIVILLLVNVLFSESFTSGSSNSVRKLAYLRASVDSYINEARLLLSDMSDVEVMKVALLLSVKDNEKELMKEKKDNEKAMALMEEKKDNEKAMAMALMEEKKDKALSIKENYYLKKLCILSLRYHHTY